MGLIALAHVTQATRSSSKKGAKEVLNLEDPGKSTAKLPDLPKECMFQGCTKTENLHYAHNRYYHHCSLITTTKSRQKKFPGVIQKKRFAHWIKLSKFKKAFPKLAKLHAKYMQQISDKLTPKHESPKGKNMERRRLENLDERMGHQAKV